MNFTKGIKRAGVLFGTLACLGGGTISAEEAAAEKPAASKATETRAIVHSCRKRRIRARCLTGPAVLWICGDKRGFEQRQKNLVERENEIKAREGSIG